LRLYSTDVIRTDFVINKLFTKKKITVTIIIAIYL
jgi:hypothetical protein